MVREKVMYDGEGLYAATAITQEHLSVEFASVLLLKKESLMMKEVVENELETIEDEILSTENEIASWSLQLKRERAKASKAHQRQGKPPGKLAGLPRR